MKGDTSFKEYGNIFSHIWNKYHQIYDHVLVRNNALQEKIFFETTKMMCEELRTDKFTQLILLNVAMIERFLDKHYFVL